MDMTGCANCGQVMAWHPWTNPDNNTECQSFVDPDFVDGVGIDQLTSEISDAPWSEPTRSNVHGVSTAGYGDDVKTPMIGSTEWLQWQSRVNPQVILRRKAEIELVQPAFRAAWRMFYMGGWDVVDKLNREWLERDWFKEKG